MTIRLRNAINKKPPFDIILDSYIIFIIGAIGVPIYIFSLYDTLAFQVDSKFGWKMFLYYVVGMIILIGWYMSATIIKIESKYIIKKRLFGIFGFSIYDITNIRKIKIKCDSAGRATLLRMTFEDGRRLELAYFQRNFSKALVYITNAAPNSAIFI